MWRVDIQFQTERRVVNIKSETLVKGLRESINNGRIAFYGVDESTGEAVWLNWENAVSVRVTSRDEE